MREYGVAVLRGVEQIEFRARALHETGKWTMLVDCSNAFSTVNMGAVLADVATCVQTLAPFVV